MNNSYFQPKKPSYVLYAIVGFFIIGLIVAAAIFFQPFRIPFTSQALSGEGFYAFTLYVASSDGAFTPASYEFSKDRLLYVKGDFQQDRIEKISQLSNASNYSISAYSSGYYPESSSCYLYDADSECGVNLTRKGEIFINTAHLSDFYDNGVIWSRDGMIRNGTLCIGWSNIQRIEISLPQTDIPQRLSAEHDRCYMLPYNLSGVYHFDINITHLPSFSPDRKYHITFADLCTKDCIEDKKTSVFY